MSGWMIETLVASALLMAVVMMVRRPVAHLFGARIGYLLWTLPLLRLALPPLPVDSAAGAVLPATFDQGRDFVVMQVVGDAPPAPEAFPWVELAIGLWIAGVAVFALTQVVGYARFRRLLLSDGEVVGRDGKVTIIESAHATGPLAFGILRKYVALPIDFADRYDPQEREMALAHELAHHARGDLLANMLALGVLGLHWCNPIAWIAYRAFRADQELACDAKVLGRADGADAQAYGRAILKAASGRHFAAACHLNTVHHLKGRLKMLSSHARSLHRISLGMAAVAILTVIGLALTASGSHAAQEMASVSRTMGDARLMRLASLLPQGGAEEAAPVAAPAPATPPTPAVPAVRHEGKQVVRFHGDDLHVAPPSPPAPLAPLPVIAPPAVPSVIVPPLPPIPPAPPKVDVNRSTGAVTVRFPDGRVERHRIPSAAEIAAMTPDVQVRQDCRSGDGTDISDTQRDGRRHIRVQVCAERAAREGRAEALRSLRQARADVAAQREDMGAAVQARVLADMDRQIARMEQRGD